MLDLVHNPTSEYTRPTRASLPHGESRKLLLTFGCGVNALAYDAEFLRLVAFMVPGESLLVGIEPERAMLLKVG